jgi:hypothetical protein
MSKASRITPELIANTHAQLSHGLSMIAEQAPTAIKGQLQATFDSHVLQQTMQYNEKMISQQKEDQKDLLINGIDLNIQNITEAAHSGDIKTAESLVEQTRKMAESGHAIAALTPEQARTAHETAQQALINGKYTYLATQAQKEGKLAEFEKEYANKKPAGITNAQWIAGGQAMSQQMNFLQTLRSQDENLKAQDMLNAIAMTGGKISPTQWQNFENSVSPIKAAEVKFKLIQAQRKDTGATIDSDNLIRNYSNPEAHANASEKIKNEAFNKGVDYTLQQAQGKGAGLSRDDAQVQVAASAGAQVPVFTNLLKNKLSSGNPAMIESAAQQIHALTEMGAGHALAGLSDADKAAYTKYEALRDSMQPTDAAREMVNQVYNQDPEQQQANQQRWSNYLSMQTKAGITLTDVAMKAADLSPSDFYPQSMANVYGTSILSKFGTFYQLTNGDEQSAKKLTKQFVDQNFGETRVNGGSYKTLHPLEMVLGFESHDGVPFIQQDVINQFNQHAMPMRLQYQDKKINEYWEAEPLSTKKHGIFSTTYDPIKVTRHMRTAKGEEKETFDLVLQGNAFDNWDMAVQGKNGMRNLFQAAPYLGFMAYKPDVKSIREAYLKAHPLK